MKPKIHRHVFSEVADITDQVILYYYFLKGLL